MMRIWFLLLLELLFLPVLGWSQSVVGKLDSTSFLIGDQTRLGIELQTNREIDRVIISKTVFDTVEAIEFVGQSPIYKRQHDDYAVYQRDLLIAFFDTGQYYIPTIPVVLQSAAGTDTLLTLAIPVEVNPVMADSASMADNKPIIREPWKLVDAWPIALGLLAFGTLALIIWSRRKGKKTSEVEVIEIPKSPLELALIALEILEQEQFLPLGKIKEHYARLSVILRTYLERELQFPAMEMTTREINYQLESAQLNEGTRKNVLANLAQIDLIKYAKVKPESAQILGSLGHTRNQLHDLQAEIDRLNSLIQQQEEEE